MTHASGNGKGITLKHTWRNPETAEGEGETERERPKLENLAKLKQTNCASNTDAPCLLVWLVLLIVSQPVSHILIHVAPFSVSFSFTFSSTTSSCAVLIGIVIGAADDGN